MVQARSARVCVCVFVGDRECVCACMSMGVVQARCA